MNDIRSSLIDRFYNLSEGDFESLALDIFQYQATYNQVYKSYLDYLSFDQHIDSIAQIPCLPIQFFKSKLIQTGEWSPSILFESSGTTGQITSKHHIRDLEVYSHSAILSFEHTYGSVQDWCFLALLPHYLERQHSSLVHMVQMFTERSGYPESGFYLDNMEELITQIRSNQEKQIPTVLIGVSFALLDLVETHDVDLSGVVVMETGGMKGRRAEWDKATLHRYLIENLKVDKIHSEYGMTELLSQCYSTGDGRFDVSPHMRILTKEVADPQSISKREKSGVINVIDLANIDSCAFIETQDIGIIHENGQFSLQGRLDHSDIRGCNLMVI